MVERDQARRWGNGRRVLVVGVALLLAACGWTTAEDDTADYVHVDWLADWGERNEVFNEATVAWLRTARVERLPVYTEVVAERFPVTVEPRVAILTLAGNGEATSATEMAKFDRFITAYLTNGHGQLTIAVPASGNAKEQALATGRRIVERALERGLRETEVVMRIEDSGGAARLRIVASYETFDVRVPVCGDWSKESSHDVTNTVHSNFGCATQRNVAVMVANPADLVTMRAPGLGDTPRRIVILGKYRAGEPTGAKRAEEEKAQITVIGASP